ncbi:MAG TPA: tetratricopeptide repeat protein [Steroidobacteraceae bacterium]|nr:tetratricopeptide repeat protein [Steroidobacteraceae bacterium]
MGYGLFLPGILIEVALIVHCLRTGRNWLWILAIVLLGPLGWIAYGIVELLPALFGSRGARGAVRGMRRALDPGQDLRRYEAEVQRSGDVASRQHYAEALIHHGRAREAVEVYRQALSGLYESDPDLMLALARAQFAAQAYGEARATLEELMKRNPTFQSPDRHLLYARALEAEGNAARALEEYAAVARYYAGAEAAVRYAQLLRASGDAGKARAVLQDLLDNARSAPRYYRRMQRHWLVTAEHELSSLR